MKESGGHIRAGAMRRRLGALFYRDDMLGDGVLALLVALACVALYLPTLSPSVVMDDGGELQMLSAVLGVAHPTGYPLFLLLGWVFAHLPLGGDVAFRVTLFCTLSAGAAMAFLYLVARELGAGRVPALAAALLLASAQRIWMHAAATEVYSLANLFVLLCTWLLLRWGAGKAPLWAAALAFGFGLTHHIQLRLFGPAALIYVLLVEPRLPLRPRRWLPALAALLLPLLLYLYIPLRANHYAAMPEWAGLVLGVRKLVASGLVTPHYFGGGPLKLILASDYSQQFWSSQNLGLNTLSQFFDMTRQQFPLATLPIILVGIGVLICRQGKASLYLLLSFALILWTALKFLADIGEDGDHFIPIYLLMAVWFSAGADALLAWGRQRLHAWPWSYTLLIAALWALPVFNIVTHFPEAMSRRQVDIGPQARDALSQPLPPGAVLAGTWPHITPLRYLQRVEGMRPDLWVIATDTIGISKLVARAIATQWPFYVIRPSAAGLRLLPVPVWDERIIKNPADVRLGETVRWRGYELQPSQPRAGDVLRLTLYWQTDAPLDRDWITFIHLLDEQGEKVAQVDELPVGEFYRPSAWQPGLLLASQHELELPADLPAGRYRLIFGWYSGAERLEWEDGQDARMLTEIVIP